MSEAYFEAEPRFTYGDYLRWPDTDRWEIIDGICYKMGEEKLLRGMTPAPNRRHQAISMELSRQLANALKGRPCKVYAAPFDVRLPELPDEEDEEIRTTLQPDLSVYCDRSKLDDAGARGAPDFIIEILSPWGAKHDHGRKAGVYERHGVREYWIIDPIGKTVAVRLLDNDGRYRRPAVHEGRGTLAITVLPGIEIDLSEVFSEDF